MVEKSCLLDNSSLDEDGDVFHFTGRINLENSVLEAASSKKTYSQNSKQSVCLDLHDCDLKTAKEQLQELILSCKQRRIKKIKIITGKGIHSGERGPVVKRFIQDYLSNNPNIKWRFATPKRGGNGVFEIKLP